MRPRISIIIPIYNTGDILIDTIESVIHQTFSDFELILVNDGSTDNSPEICEQYARIDSRIRVIHKDNGGICDARNVGLKECQGEYITFCDHDDIYLHDILQKEYELVTNYDADISIVGKEYIYENRRAAYGANLHCSNRKELENSFFDIVNNSLLDTIWNILYKRECIGDVLFDISNKKGQEDFKFNISILDNVKVLCSTNEVLYHHIIRTELSTSAKIHEEVIDSLIENNNLKLNKMLQYQLNCQMNNLGYVDMQGEGFLSVASYTIKAQKSYSEFRKIINKLEYIKVKPAINSKCNLKHVFMYWCFSRKNFLIPYIALKISEQK